MRTSINFRMTDLERLSNECLKCRLNRSALIQKCLESFFNSGSNQLKQACSEFLIRYQPNGTGYSIRNVVLSQDLLNLAKNFRVFCRFSISFFVSMALDYYFDQKYESKPKEQEEEEEHNYVKIQYAIKKIVPENCIKWQITWKIRERKAP
ncbi:MAG: hypothetical protein PF637_00345 [Spirochaetes bacterium]|jgi:hypothetical protein|nr:hypothetical protein [Spirochaetota bacterium]